MKRKLQNLAIPLRTVADLIGHTYLTGPLGAKELRRYLPQVPFNGLNPQWNNLLVLAPHPDDEIFGTGLLLQSASKENKKITIAFATAGEAYTTDKKGSRKSEAIASAQQFNTTPIFLGLQDGQLQNTPDLAQKLNDLVSKIQPDAIALPWFADYHPDHRALAKAAIANPHLQADYLFYSTFSPLYPTPNLTLNFLAGPETNLRQALAQYSTSVNQDTVEGFFTLRKATARAYMNTKSFWEPYLTIPGKDLHKIQQTATTWPQHYPTLIKSRHYNNFLKTLKSFPNK